MRRVILPALILSLLLCAGCGAGARDYPELPAADTNGMTLETTENNILKVDYPADKWIADEGTDPLVLYYIDTLDSDTGYVNINVQLSQAYSGKLTESVMKKMIGDMESQVGFINVSLSELRMLNGEPVIYSEATMSFDDDTIDFMVESGEWTEEWIEENGGRETFLAIPDTKQVYIYAAVDGNLYIYVGTYYENADKEALIDAMTVLVQTTQAK